MTEEIICPHCGEKEKRIEIGRTDTFSGPVIQYKCLNPDCRETFDW